MFSEILNFKPRLDPADFRKMEKSLTTRFGQIAKKFGKGIASGLAGGGLVGVGIGLLEKILNPLKETQEAIDRTLKTADDLITNATQFNTTGGKLLKLQAYAGATGLDPGDLFMLITKFQASVSEAKLDPNKPTAVRNFTDNADIAESFFEFIQAVKKLDPDKQVAVQQEVFGEKQILKMSEFLNADFGKLQAQMRLPNAGDMTERLKRTADVSDLTDMFTQRRLVNDLMNKAPLINGGMAASRDQQAKLELQRENERISQYQTLMKADMAMSQIVAWFESQGMELVKQVQQIARDGMSISQVIAKIPTLRGLRGMFGGGDK